MRGGRPTPLKQDKVPDAGVRNPRSPGVWEMWTPSRRRPTLGWHAHVRADIRTAPASRSPPPWSRRRCSRCVWIAPRASGTAADWVHAQPVRLHTVGMPDGARLGVARPSGRAAAGPVILDSGEQFFAAGVLCDVPSGGAVTIRLRTSADGTAWGPWTDLPLEVAGEGGVRSGLHRPRLDGRVQVPPGQGRRRRRGPDRPHQRARRRHRPLRRRKHRGAAHRRRTPRSRRRGRHHHRPAGPGGLRHPGHRHPVTVGRRRASALRLALLLPGQDGLRPPHGRQQHVHPGRRSCAGQGDLRLPHQEPGLERHRLQLPGRPVRQCVRRPIRRHHARGRRRARVRLQHRQHRRVGHGHLHRCGARRPWR